MIVDIVSNIYYYTSETFLYFYNLLPVSDDTLLNEWIRNTLPIDDYEFDEPRIIHLENSEYIARGYMEASRVRFDYTFNGFFKWYVVYNLQKIDMKVGSYILSREHSVKRFSICNINNPEIKFYIANDAMRLFLYKLKEFKIENMIN